MKNTFKVLLAASVLTTCICCSPTPGLLPPWQEGYLDIHQISTGRGNAALVIMPDGTNLLVDCGDDAVSQASEHNEVLPALPDSSRSAARWVIDYFRHFAPGSVNDTTIDYALITHYHKDHMGYAGSPSAVRPDSLSFALSGITELGVLIPVTTLINRSDSSCPGMPDNYKAYIREWREPRGQRTESLEVGRNDQIVLLHNPGAYPSFEVRNVISSRTVWTGDGCGTASLGEGEYCDENARSCGIVISYGDFDYISCGDIPGTYPEPDGETVLAYVVGECDVAVACHHGYQEAMNPCFCRALDPTAFIVPSREYWHPSGMAVETMCNDSLYSGRPSVFCAGLLESTRRTMEGLGFGDRFMPDGHVVVRVSPGGSSFRIYVLDDRSAGRGIIYASEEYASGN